MDFAKRKHRLAYNVLKSRNLKHISFPLLFIVLSLLGLGLVALYSASSIYAYNKGMDSLFFVRRQALWIVMGLCLTALAARVDMEKMRTLIKPAVALTLILLVVTLLMPPVAHVRRWIKLGFMNLQTSEFAKIVLVLYLADFFDRKHSRLASDWRRLLTPLAVMVAMLVLIGKEPDLGTPALMFATATLIFFAAGVHLKHIFLAIAAALPIVIFDLFRHPYRLARIRTFLSPGSDTAGAGYQLNQSLLAVGSGGWTGKGLGASQIKLMYLPDPHTDFIFPVVAEEMGLIGSLLIVLLFLALLIKGIRIARNAQTLYSTLAALGLTLTISLQAFFNIAMTIGIIPTKGIPLPFFSYGGSSILATLIGVGLILNVSAHRNSAA